MPPQKETKISCIGISYIQPIIDLYSKLGSRKFTGESKTQVSPFENGYSVSIIALCVLCIESAINRVKYLENRTERNVLEFFKQRFNNSQLLQKLYELYVLRDLIVHNHIWKIGFDYDGEYKEQNIDYKLLEGYGDRKFDQNVDKENMRTRTLGLNINPIKIGKEDVIKVLEVLSEFFGFIESLDKKYFALSHFLFVYDGKQITFYDFVKSLKSTR